MIKICESKSISHNLSHGHVTHRKGHVISSLWLCELRCLGVLVPEFKLCFPCSNDLFGNGGFPDGMWEMGARILLLPEEELFRRDSEPPTWKLGWNPWPEAVITSPPPVVIEFCIGLALVLLVMMLLARLTEDWGGEEREAPCMMWCCCCWCSCCRRRVRCICNCWWVASSPGEVENKVDPAARRYQYH